MLQNTKTQETKLLIASIMESCGEGIAREQRTKDYLHSRSFPDLPIDP
jgi:hypothetical protein